MTKVLLVEDDVWLNELETTALKAAGYDVTSVLHAMDAIEAVDTSVPDVIVLDVLLGGTTGFGLLHELQTYNDTQLIPVVLQSNLAEDFDVKQLKAYGVSTVVDKTTMQFDDVIAAIKAAIL